VSKTTKKAGHSNRSVYKETIVFQSIFKYLTYNFLDHSSLSWELVFSSGYTLRYGSSGPVFSTTSNALPPACAREPSM